jgi:glycosyltransferase involved in cell wall biosynthesis
VNRSENKMSDERRHPKVSIGMPVYNAERYLEQALDSILSQTFDDFELVISDNASTDRTEEICKKYAAKDSRVRYFRQRQNYGLIYNFNVVFRLSGGEYFKWAASDDICAPDYLARAVEVLDSDPSVVLAWAKTVGIDENGNRVPMRYEVSDLNSPESVYSPDPTVRFRRLIENIFWADGPLYGVMRSSALASTKALHPRHMSGDQILLTELSLMGRLYEIPEELFFSRVHAQKTSHSQKDLRARATLVDQKPPGRGPIGWWRLIRGYPLRLAMYVGNISRASLSARQKLKCYFEVCRGVGSWALLRIGQVSRGESPWRR